MSRSKPNFITAILSVALVLFMVGFFALTALHGSRLVNIFKERVDIWLELQPDLTQEQISAVTGSLRAQPFVKKETISFISHEQAAATMRRELGDESLLNELPNLMRDVLRFNVKAEYFYPDSLATWRDQMKQDTLVADLFYEATSTGNIGENIEKIGWFTLALGILLIFAAVTLIHNTIRLALYANRFLIKNQELVGASWEFISRPYIRRGIINGIWSAFIAIAALSGLLWTAQRQIPALAELQDANGTILIFIGLLALGVLISGLSSYFVVNKFLRMRIDDLY